MVRGWVVGELKWYTQGARHVDAVVIGGGPAGLAAAIALARDGVQVLLVERGNVNETLDDSRSYSYGLDARGQSFTEAFGLREALRRQSLSYLAMQRTLIVGPKGVKSGKPIWSRRPQQTEFSPTVLMPRSAFLQLLLGAAKASGVETLFNTTFESVSLAAEGPLATVALRDRHERLYYIQTRLVLGCDGAFSRVRAAMKSLYDAGKADVKVAAAPRNRSCAGAWLFEPVEMRSPSAGLNFRVLTFPKGFFYRDEATGEGKRAAPHVLYSVQGRARGPQRRLGFALMPVKDESRIRTGSIIRKAGHDVWKCRTGDELLTFLQEEFPQLDIRELLGIEQANEFVRGETGVFPAPQFVRGLHVVLKEGQRAAGMVLLGDSIHAFPPDVGEGVNAAMEDVMGLRQALLETATSRGLGRDASAIPAILRTPELLQNALDVYQSRRAAEAEAVARIARVAAPYQYRQSPRAEKMFLLGFFLRKSLAGLALRVGLGRVIALPVALQLSTRFEMITPYSVIWTRAQRTTMVFVLLILASLVSLTREVTALVTALAAYRHIAF